MYPTILAIESSTPQILVALGLPDGEVLSVVSSVDRRQASLLVPTISGLLQKADLKLDAIEAIAVGLGPGSFTGLRVGMTVAKTLAHVTGVRLMGLGSLDVIAWNLRQVGCRVVAASDAQRGEWYVARYLAHQEQMECPVLAGPLTIESAEGVISSLRVDQVLIGPAQDRAQSSKLFPAGIQEIDSTLNYPRPFPLFQLARSALTRNAVHDPMTLEPIYIRRSAAEEKADREVKGQSSPGGSE